MLERLRARLTQTDAPRPSWRELATAAGVSLSSLTHYFGKRDDVVRAVMEDDLIGGAEPLRIMATPEGDFAQSVAAAVRHVIDGMLYGNLDGLFAMGLAEGLDSSTLGPVFLTNALEPTLAACEARLTSHIEKGEMRHADVRVAALALIAPVIVAGLHQTRLGGREVRKLDLQSFAIEHAAAFVRAWQFPPAAR